MFSAKSMERVIIVNRTDAYYDDHGHDYHDCRDCFDDLAHDD